MIIGGRRKGLASRRRRLFKLGLLLEACLLAPALLAQGASSAAGMAPSSEREDNAATSAQPVAARMDSDEVVFLDPFTVSTGADKGYKATNATSGTRLDTAIKDLPMPIEVITSEFIRDTGATTLREALKYSAGIQLQSQNDYAGNGLSQYQNIGGVNNPEMQTASKTGTSFVIRGFTSDNALRDGFRRKISTDASNISRIEVVRGPAALLYGIGNFGGVVNYVVKMPETSQKGAVDLAVGSNGFTRTTVDVTGPMAGKRGGYRITAAAQTNGDYTDYYDNEGLALSSIFSIHPWRNTELTLDVEYGRNRTSGLGFQSIRARADAVNNSGAMEHAGFIAFPGVDLRTMRWSGPDTYLKSDQGNLELKLTQHLAEGLDLLAAYDHSSVTFRSRDVNASVGNNIGPQALWSTLIPVPLDATRGDTDANWSASPVPHSIIAYSWADKLEGTRADQARVDLNYVVEFFRQSPTWTLRNNFLVGVGMERDSSTSRLHSLDNAHSVYDWKSAADPTPFHYATQGDGSASLPLRLRHQGESIARETGYYAAYQGKFLRNMVTLLGGFRWDTNGVSTHDVGYNYSDGTVDAGATSSFAPSNKTYRTSQIGISFTPFKAMSLYALRSEGLNPNFSGARDLTGRPMDAVTAVNQEFGVKFDFAHGRISGTVSHYRITRTGQPNGSFWWGPQTATHKFDPTQPVVYNVTDLNPDAARKYTYTDNTGSVVPLIQWNNNYSYWGDLTKYSQVPAGAAGSTATSAGLQSYQQDGLNAQRDAIQTAWSAAKTSGAVRYWDKNGNSINESAFGSLIASGGPTNAFATLTASSPAGAAYMDALYTYFRAAGLAHPGSDNWPGWFFNSAPTGTGYNSAAQDTNGFANSSPLFAPESDRNEGWDGQFIITPNDNWQILFSFEKNNHTILSLGRFPDYPYQNLDRWAPWMFPNGQWGLSGYYGTNEQYANEASTSTFSFKGLIYPGAQGMDYPKWSWSLFANYRFTGHGLGGLKIGGGVLRTGPQEYESGFTHGGDALKDNSGTPLILTTPLRWTADVFVHYDFKIARRDSYVQININNLLNDRKRYGLLWAPGRTVLVSLGTRF